MFVWNSLNLVNHMYTPFSGHQIIAQRCTRSEILRDIRAHNQTYEVNYVLCLTNNIIVVPVPLLQIHVILKST